MATRKTRNFREHSALDNWGDWSKISQSLIDYLQELRDHIGCPIYVTSGYRKDTKSQHSKGLAVDIISPYFTDQKSLLDLYLAAERFPFKGIGVYPYWKSHQGVMCGGLHLDLRNEQPARWLGLIGSTSSSYPKYIGLTKQNLKKHGVIND